MQHANSPSKASECPEGIALLPGRQFDCHSVQIVIGFLTRQQLTPAQKQQARDNTSLARTQESTQTTAGATERKLTSRSV